MDALGGRVSRCLLHDHVQHLSSNTASANDESLTANSNPRTLSKKGDTESSTEFIVYHRPDIVPPTSFGADARGEIAIAVPVSQELEPQVSTRQSYMESLIWTNMSADAEMC